MKKRTIVKSCRGLWECGRTGPEPVSFAVERGACPKTPGQTYPGKKGVFTSAPTKLDDDLSCTFGARPSECERRTLMAKPGASPPRVRKQGARKMRYERRDWERHRATVEGGGRRNLSARQLATLRALALQEVESNPGPEGDVVGRLLSAIGASLARYIRRHHGGMLLARPADDVICIWACGFDEDGVDADSERYYLSASQLRALCDCTPVVRRSLMSLLASARRESQLWVWLRANDAQWVRDLTAEGIEPNPGPAGANSLAKQDAEPHVLPCQRAANECNRPLHFHTAARKGQAAPGAEQRIARQIAVALGKLVKCDTPTAECPRLTHYHMPHQPAAQIGPKTKGPAHEVLDSLMDDDDDLDLPEPDVAAGAPPAGMRWRPKRAAVVPAPPAAPAAPEEAPKAPAPKIPARNVAAQPMRPRPTTSGPVANKWQPKASAVQQAARDDGAARVARLAAAAIAIAAAGVRKGGAGEIAAPDASAPAAPAGPAKLPAQKKGAPRRADATKAPATRKTEGAGARPALQEKRADTGVRGTTGAHAPSAQVASSRSEETTAAPAASAHVASSSQEEEKEEEVVASRPMAMHQPRRCLCGRPRDHLDESSDDDEDDNTVLAAAYMTGSPAYGLPRPFTSSVRAWAAAWYCLLFMHFLVCSEEESTNYAPVVYASSFFFLAYYWIRRITHSIKTWLAMRARAQRRQMISRVTTRFNERSRMLLDDYVYQQGIDCEEEDQDPVTMWENYGFGCVHVSAVYPELLAEVVQSTAYQSLRTYSGNEIVTFTPNKVDTLVREAAAKHKNMNDASILLQTTRVLVNQLQIKDFELRRLNPPAVPESKSKESFLFEPGVAELSTGVRIALALLFVVSISLFATTTHSTSLPDVSGSSTAN